MPKSPVSLHGHGICIPTRERKLQAIQTFRKLIPFLFPDPSVSHAVLWHTDLHGENIFVDPNDRTTLTSIIDWQAIGLSPLFVHVGRPNYLDFDGEKPEELRRPEPPDGFDDEDPQI